MESLLLISAAFICGLIAGKSNLPPLVGFLLAGFVLNFYGFQSNEAIELIAELGVILLLFTIGLKLNISNLLAKDIWLGATLHNALSTAIFGSLFCGLKLLGLNVLADITPHHLMLIAFALSFSSTVFAIKTLQEKGEVNSIYGNLAIGILVMQDIFAVIYLTSSTGEPPQWYAIGLFALPILRPLLFKILDNIKHTEMLVLFGIFLALVVGGGLFHLVGLKPDLGALISGMLITKHPKASHLSKSLLNIKELFLVCFFLNIGLSAPLSLTGITLGAIFLVLLPIKSILYLVTMHLFKFRVRTSLLASLTLSNYSEFGLIVGGFTYSMGWIPNDVLVALAVAVALSFIIAAPINNLGHQIYLYAGKWMQDVADEKLNAKDQLINIGNAQILILGMGRIGAGAYDELYQRYGDIILGVDTNNDGVIHHQFSGRRAIYGDSTDPDFWERIKDVNKIKLILLAMPHHYKNQGVLQLLTSRKYQGQIAAIAEYNDHIDELLAEGANAAFNIYREAGSGFASHVCEQLDICQKFDSIK